MQTLLHRHIIRTLTDPHMHADIHTHEYIHRHTHHVLSGTYVCMHTGTHTLSDSQTPPPPHTNTVTLTHVKEEEENTESGRKVGEAGVERVGGKRRELCDIQLYKNVKIKIT